MKDQAIDEFVGRDQRSERPSLRRTSCRHLTISIGFMACREAAAIPSPGGRTRLNADSQASQAREVATLEARSKAFGKRRMGS